MTTHTIYTTVAEAIAANEAKALAEGCDPNTTSEWWVRYNHPSDGRAALADDLGTITEAELITEGFISDPEATPDI